MKPRLSDLLFKRLQKAIIKGDYPPGSRFPAERDLAEQLRTSRTTVREAVSKLAQVGLVETLPQSGTYVTDYNDRASLDLLVNIMTQSDIVDSEVLLSIMEFRKLIEIFSVKKLLTRIDGKDVTAFRALIEEEEAAKTLRATAECDYRFHIFLVTRSGNFIAELIFKSIRPLYLFLAESFYRTPGARDVVLSQHRRFLEALSRGDREAAASVMDEILRYGEETVRRLFGLTEEKKMIDIRNLNIEP